MSMTTSQVLIPLSISVAERLLRASVEPRSLLEEMVADVETWGPDVVRRLRARQS